MPFGALPSCQGHLYSSGLPSKDMCHLWKPFAERWKDQRKQSLDSQTTGGLIGFFLFLFFSCFQLKSVAPNSLCFTTHPYPSYTRSSCVKSPCTDSCTISGFNFRHSYPPITIGKGLFYEAVSSCICVHVIEVWGCRIMHRHKTTYVGVCTYTCQQTDSGVSVPWL